MMHYSIEEAGCHVRSFTWIPMMDDGPFSNATLFTASLEVNSEALKPIQQMISSTTIHLKTVALVGAGRL